jgi:PAS domain S-box-containing protein
VVALVCFGIFTSAVCFFSLRSLEAEKTHIAFQRVAGQRMDDLQSDLDLTVSKVVAAGAFCESSAPIARSSFDHFAAALLAADDPGIQALEWAPRVTSLQRSAFERDTRDGGVPDFEIRDRLALGRMGRAADRPLYFPVLAVKPYAGNEAALGFDLLSDKSRRDAIMRAAYTGELTATARITLVQETSGQYGILLFRPVYLRAEPSAGKLELLGLALGVVRFGNVVEKRGANSGVDVTVTDLSAPYGEQRLYPPAGKQPQPNSSFTQYRNISVGGRNWQLAATPMPGAFPTTRAYSYGGSALCLLFTLLAAALASSTLNRRRDVERLVEERTGLLNTANHALAEAHRGLEESEARFRHLTENSPNAIMVERQGKIVLVNRSAVELLGFDPTLDSRDHHLAEFVVPERRAIAERVVCDLYAREMRLDVTESRGLRRDGSVVDIELSASSFLDAGQQTIQVNLRDISGRKQNEAENARLISAIAQVGESIVMTDLDARIVYVNPAFEHLTGYTREEALGKNPRVLKSGVHSQQFYAQLWDALKAGESWTGRFVNRAKNGRLFTEEATISPVVNREGETINYVAVKRDVTLEIEMEEQLHQSRKMDAVGRLAGGVAHDFNNMLMVIVSYADLLANYLPEHDPLRKYTEEILHAAGRASSLTRQLLAFSRKQVLAPQILDCNVLLLETSSMVRRLIAENIELKCDCAPDLWPVRADADQLVQVILNLCLNSRDAMPNGGSLTLASRNFAVDEGFVEISVADTGIGISVELQEKLFEPFFTTKERGKGTGLGLATVYGIVQQSGGSIRVTSSPGNGATFHILLPRCLQAAPAPTVSTPRPFIAGSNLVLVVEDEDALRQAIAEHLRSHGYQVLVAVDGLQALDVLDTNPKVSILVSDLIMPRMGGREMVRLALQKYPHLRVVLMTGYDDQARTDQDCVECCAVCLQKPFSMDRLLTALAELDLPTDAAAETPAIAPGSAPLL